MGKIGILVAHRTVGSVTIMCPPRVTCLISATAVVSMPSLLTYVHIVQYYAQPDTAASHFVHPLTLSCHSLLFSRSLN